MTKLKLGTHMDSGLIYRVYWKPWGCWCLFVPWFVNFSFHFKTFKIFVSLFSETVKPTKSKLGTHMDWVDVSCILSLLSSFLSPVSKHQFSQELWGLERWNLVHTWRMNQSIVYTNVLFLTSENAISGIIYILSDKRNATTKIKVVLF